MHTEKKVLEFLKYSPLEVFLKIFGWNRSMVLYNQKENYFRRLAAFPKEIFVNFKDVSIDLKGILSKQK